MDIFKYLRGTEGKFITLIICIYIKIQIEVIYEKVRGTLEGIMAQGQVSSDSTTYLWAKLLGDGSIIDMVNFILYIIIIYVAFKIGTTISANKLALSTMNKITRKTLF